MIVLLVARPKPLSAEHVYIPEWCLVAEVKVIDNPRASSSPLGILRSCNKEGNLNGF